MSSSPMSRQTKEPILGYVPKNEDKKIHAFKVNIRALMGGEECNSCF